MNALLQKLKESAFSVLPITIMVLILAFTISPINAPHLLRFILGSLFITLGLAIFLFGVEIGIDPIGHLMGSLLTKTNKIWIVAVASLALGFFISVAEPDLHILANQVDFVTSGVISKVSIVVIVSIGIAVMLSFGLIRILYNIPLYKVLTVVYLIIFVIAIFVSPEFLAISFDASGATTGALTVPFILALALGASSMKKDSGAAEKDSFGLVAVTSTGAIIAVMIMNLFLRTDEITATLKLTVSDSASIVAPFLQNIPSISMEIMIALSPLCLVFLIFQKISFKLTRKARNKILKGLFYSFFGLVLFLTGVNAGFMDVGKLLGYNIASLGNNFLLLSIGFIIGMVTILAEPAVYVLTHQIEIVTSGYIKRKLVLATLSIGVGFAVILSMIRIITPNLFLWHYLLPGYIIALAMTYFVPKLFVGIAFDSGGVASGPMTATFILAFAQGAANAVEGADVLIDGFGVISMVALTPLIALQTLGLIFKIKSKKGGLKQDEQLS